MDSVLEEKEEQMEEFNEYMMLPIEAFTILSFKRLKFFKRNVRLDEINFWMLKYIQLTGNQLFNQITKLSKLYSLLRNDTVVNKTDVFSCFRQSKISRSVFLVQSIDISLGFLDPDFYKKSVFSVERIYEICNFCNKLHRNENLIISRDALLTIGKYVETVLVNCEFESLNNFLGFKLPHITKEKEFKHLIWNFFMNRYIHTSKEKIESFSRQISYVLSSIVFMFCEFSEINQKYKFISRKNLILFLSEFTDSDSLEIIDSYEEKICSLNYINSLVDGNYELTLEALLLLRNLITFFLIECYSKRSDMLSNLLKFYCYEDNVNKISSFEELKSVGNEMFEVTEKTFFEYRPFEINRENIIDKESNSHNISNHSETIFDSSEHEDPKTEKNMKKIKKEYDDFEFTIIDDESKEDSVEETIFRNFLENDKKEQLRMMNEIFKDKKNLNGYVESINLRYEPDVIFPEKDPFSVFSSL